MGDMTPEEKMMHKSDCAVHNAPAYEPGPCNCRENLTPEVRARDLADVFVEGEVLGAYAEDLIAEAIRQAEQATREEMQHKLDAALKRETLALELALQAEQAALERAAKVAEPFDRVAAEQIRALAKEQNPVEEE